MPETPLLSASLGGVLLTRAWIFQSLIAAPILIILGGLAFGSVYERYYGAEIYYFVLYLGNAILAAAVIFVVLVQRQLKPAFLFHTRKGKRLTFYLELAKSVLATVLWLWILLDSIFKSGGSYYPAWRRRIICCLIAYIVLLIFWYPTVWYSLYALTHQPDEPEEEEEDNDEDRPSGASRGRRERENEAGERTPLLSSDAGEAA